MAVWGLAWRFLLVDPGTRPPQPSSGRLRLSFNGFRNNAPSATWSAVLITGSRTVVNNPLMRALSGDSQAVIGL